MGKLLIEIKQSVLNFFKTQFDCLSVSGNVNKKAGGGQARRWGRPGGDDGRSQRWQRVSSFRTCPALRQDDTSARGVISFLEEKLEIQNFHVTVHFKIVKSYSYFVL